MAIGDMAVVKLVTLTTSPRFENAWYFRALTASTNWRQELVDEFADTMLYPFFHDLSEDVTLHELRCEDVVPGTGATAFWTGPATWQGDYLGPGLPPNCAAVLQWRSDLLGRANRGRTYFAGYPMAAVDPGSDNWGALGQTHLEAFGTAMMAQFSRVTGLSSVGFLVVCSRQLDGVPRGPVGIQVDRYQLNYKVCSQRRRSRFS